MSIFIYIFFFKSFSDSNNSKIRNETQNSGKWEGNTTNIFHSNAVIFFSTMNFAVRIKNY